ncbi:hypothetical protein L3X38_029662 [Prunus dulcis]|uniref:Uncharacterized protein n=1 Tax=Prunus dulcis TaxID=3755 RepID=A0AAD4Z2N3_PRUDU|nr:hypothetical protein L3X38_029662 [Prunus dulcis]
MMIEMNKAVVPGGQVCLRVVPNPNKAAAGGRRLQNLVNVLGKGKFGGNIFVSSPPPQLVAAAASTPIPIPIPRRRRLMATSNSSNADICRFIPSSPYGDPCLDLFFNSLRPDDCGYTPVCLKYRKQLLPLAWSHNPLTTLKLIFSAQTSSLEGMTFDTAVLWLHHNHPNTLLRNLHSLVNSVSYGEGLYTLVQILSNLLVQKRGGQDNDAAAHPERYDLDPDYRLLHDRVIDIFVELLKSDIDKIKHHKLKLKFLNDDDDLDDFDQLDVDGFVSAAAECCTDKYLIKGHRARARIILLCESIGRRLFPLESDQSDEWERLRKEVLVPLSKYYRRQVHTDCYHREVRERCVVEKYLEEVKAAAGGGGGNLRGGIIKLDASLPNEIIKYVRREDVREAAEVQWKAMVEDIKQGEGLGKFKNCLVVGSYPLDAKLDERYPEEAYAEAGLEILVSEVNEEPWKGKIITYSDEKYQLDLIQGHNLTSKFEFMRSVETCWTSLVECNNKEFLEVFDLILEVAVNEKLRAEQMIKKVIVFTEHLEPIDSPIWDVQYYALQSTFEVIRSKFRDKGYGDDSVPHILYFNETEQPWICTQDPGFTLLSGFSNNMFKSFLKNGGEIGPHHLMEAAIAHEEYQTLEVVD